jgi:FAD synthase
MGHRQVINRLKEEAKAVNETVMSFSSPPENRFLCHLGIRLINTLKKTELLQELVLIISCGALQMLLPTKRRRII